MRRTPAAAAALAITTLAVLVHAPPAAATAVATEHPVTRWARHAAQPATDLRRVVGDAEIVGLGEAAHGLAEITTLKARALRYLVEEKGFRSIAWEDDWSLGIRINAYIHGERDDRDALIAQMSTAWRTRAVADVLTWLRGYNRTHHDKVRFVGVEYYTTRPLSYDAVARYVARRAPDRLDEANAHIAPIRPDGDDMRAHLTWYLDVDDKAPYVGHARDLFDLVAAVPHRRDREYALALHHARQIRSYYEAFALPDAFAYRDARAAENLRWWRSFSGDKIVYWAASAHTADVPELRLTYPGQPDARFASVGSFLRDRYGDDYRSIGFTFDHGPGVPPPDPAWFEQPLGGVRNPQFLLDLRRPAPALVREWLHRPLVTRGDPEAGPASTMTGGTLAQWFDVIVHRQEVRPAAPLTP